MVYISERLTVKGGLFCLCLFCNSCSGLFLRFSTFKQLESPSIKFGGFFIWIRLSLVGKHPRLIIDGITLRKFV